MPAVPVRRKSPVRSGPTGVYRGVEGQRRIEEESAKAAARAQARRETSNQPFRYRVEPGKQGLFVILDDAPDFFRFEHTLQNPATGKYDLHIGCCAEFDNCPADLKSQAYYAMYFTVLDLIPYVSKSGVEVPFSRKLLVVKSDQQKRFMRSYERAKREHGTLRGVVFETHRDKKMDAAIGNDIHETGEVLDEESLQEYVREWKDREGVTHTEACDVPFDYDALFPVMGAAQIAELIGEYVPGSSAHNERVLRGSPAVTRRAPSTQTKPVRTARPSREVEDEYEEGRDEAEEEPIPARVSTRSRVATGTPIAPGYKNPSVRGTMSSSRARAVEPEEEPEEADGAEEEVSPSRTSRTQRTVERQVATRTVPTRGVAARPIPGVKPSVPVRRTGVPNRASRHVSDDEYDEDIPF